MFCADLFAHGSQNKGTRVGFDSIVAMLNLRRVFIVFSTGYISVLLERFILAFVGAVVNRTTQKLMIDLSSPKFVAMTNGSTDNAAL